MNEPERVQLAITAERSGTAPATWGQQAIWDAVAALGAEAARYNVSVGFAVEPARPRSAVLAALAEAVRHHEALRTRLRVGQDEELEQLLDAVGTVPVTVCRSATDATGQWGERLLAELAAQRFDTAAAWPIRIGLVESAGLVRHLVMVLSHTAADGGGLRRLARDVAALLDGAAPGRLWEAFPAVQPLDEAARQKSSRGRRQDAAARRYWLAKLRDGPRRIFPERAARDPDARYLHLVLHSPALLRAVDHVARTRRVSIQTVVLAAVARQISLIGGSPEVLLQVVVNNRFQPGMAQTVTTLAQEALFHVPQAGLGFADLVGRVQAGALASYRCASYDKRRLDRDIEGLRAVLPDLADHSCFVNDTREPELFRPPAPDRVPPLSEAREATVLRWGDEVPPRPHQTLALDVVDAPGAIELVVVADASRVPRSHMERLLCGVEGCIVEDALASGGV
ncbi:hypothetical protein LK08_05465 [Streptomyces sp. MUSC 125]|uniref:condensation domain-containing protein n=1 Tax=unclassified Streptomyces TaxID=2593676 RepID=UPI0005809048|nr:MULTISPECIES: condensation domain-containing protein [unclassified Streptomyces]KIE27911.1 hypothetical protein LK08_05465 [Streptomyces sp. MUSC 125]MCH0559319.1 non-ribosomal peptide synthetase condensation domain protein [Streptomyces sp. MUM 16J]